MKLDVLLSAMHLKNYQYIHTLNITGDCIVINQCDNNKREEVQNGSQRILYIETTERGLSKSRNMAKANAQNDICILCDNDVEYIEGYEKIILNEYEKHPEYDVIVFHVTSDINPEPCYRESRRLNYITSCKAISYEISFRKSCVEDICFNERIGAGTKYKMGEENAFLYDCLRKGLHVHYVPIEIARLRYEPSTWNQGFDKEYLMSRGASFYAMTPRYSLLLILQFAVRKYKFYKQKLSFWKALHYMLTGRQEYKSDTSIS